MFLRRRLGQTPADAAVLVGVVERLGRAVGIQCEGVPSEELAFPDQAIPFAKESHWHTS
jgi:hypothetical protein